MKTYLIPTDFSEVARNAVQYGLHFLKDSGEECRVLLLNTYLVPAAPSDQLVTVHDELRKRSMDQLEEFRRKAEAANKNSKLSFQALSHMGSLENVIDHIVKSQHVDCVIMGMSNHRKQEGVLGKNCTRVLRRVACPLLIVPS